MFMVFYDSHHVLENLSTDFERINLGAVFKQSSASQLGHLLEVHMLDSIGKFFINNPKILWK